MVRKLA